MLKWLAYPLLRASGAFALGIFTGFETNIPLPKLELLWVAFSGMYFLLALKTTGVNFSSLSPFLSVLGLMVIFLAGNLRAKYEFHEKDPRVDSADFYQAQVLEPSEYHPQYVRTVLDLQWIWSDGKAYAVNDGIQWYQSAVADSSVRQNYQNLNYGDRVIIRGTPRAINKPSNPNEFDYAGYMSRRNIFWQHWLTDSDIIKISSYQGVSMDQLKLAFRARLQQAINDYLQPGASQEIAAAMLLGDRKGVSHGLEDSFARSGTMHILAVSGLHLGILYWLLIQILGCWRNHFMLKWLFIVISLSVIWSFTLITGLAASTQRAAIMFSVLLLGNTISKESNSINTLSISAMIILWTEPYQLHSVGFQLSFLALAGILYLQPLIARWWQVQNRLLRYFWELISVSLAAQTAVLPLSIYYFHQFPVYFLLANMLLIPLAFAIIVTGVVFFISTQLPSMIFLIAAPLSQLTRTAGFIVQKIGELPGSTVHDLDISTGELAVFYGLLWTFVVFCKTRSRVYWLIFLGLCILITTTKLFDQLQIRHRRMMVAYHIPGHTALDFIDKNHFHQVMDPALAIDTTTINYKIRNFRRHLKLDHSSEQWVPYISTGTFDLWMFKGKRVLLIKAPIIKRMSGKNKFKSHIVVVSNNSVKSISQIWSWLKPDLLLIDGSNDRWIARKIEEEAIGQGLNVHNCWTQGAKIIKL